MCCTVYIRHKPRVQFWLRRSSFTFWFFLHANKYKLGAISIGACPFSQEESQKDALSPHPTVTTVEARKSALSVELHGGSVQKKKKYLVTISRPWHADALPRRAKPEQQDVEGPQDWPVQANGVEHYGGLPSLLGSWVCVDDLLRKIREKNNETGGLKLVTNCYGIIGNYIHETQTSISLFYSFSCVIYTVINAALPPLIWLNLSRF